MQFWYFSSSREESNVCNECLVNNSSLSQQLSPAIKKWPLFWTFVFFWLLCLIIENICSKKLLLCTFLSVTSVPPISFIFNLLLSTFHFQLDYWIFYSFCLNRYIYSVSLFIGLNARWNYFLFSSLDCIDSVHSPLFSFNVMFACQPVITIHMDRFFYFLPFFHASLFDHFVSN